MIPLDYRNSKNKLGWPDPPPRAVPCLPLWYFIPRLSRAQRQFRIRVYLLALLIAVLVLVVLAMPSSKDRSRPEDNVGDLPALIRQ